MKTFLTILITAAIAASASWWTTSQRSMRGTSADSANGAKKLLYYQSPMHPWVKSDKPGNCTVCGMQLVPIYEGGEKRDAASTDIVLLPEGSPNVSNIRMVEVKRQPLVRTLRVAGMIDDDDSKHRVLSAYAPARIEKLFVNFEGGEVEKGQPLAMLYSKDLLTAANEYRLLATQGGSPGLRTAVESRLKQFGLTAEQIAQIPNRKDGDLFFEIVAPIAGTVTKRYVYEGQYVQEGERLFELADFNTMWFQFVAYEQDLPFLREGLQVTINTASLPGRPIVAPIKFINPNLDDKTRSARVRVEFQNPTREGGIHRKHEVLHKTYADATVTLDQMEVISVPRNAVIWTGNNARIYVEKGSGAYEQRAVILGRPGDEMWEVLEGVQPGERVVASGNMLIDGQAQLNNLGAPQEHAEPTEMAAMADADHHAVAAYLDAIAALSEALATDDLAAYNIALAKLPPAPAGVVAEPPKVASDLVSARREFLPLSQSVADFALKVHGHFPKLKIFRCPMSDQVGGGAPENAKWIQFAADLRNPYMGKEMLRCGAEVK